MPMIKLRSSDGEEFEIDEEIAKVSVTIKTLLESPDTGIGQEGAVPLSTVNSSILKKVIQWAVVHYNDPIPLEEDEYKIRKQRSDDSSSEDEEERFDDNKDGSKRFNTHAHQPVGGENAEKDESNKNDPVPDGDNMDEEGESENDGPVPVGDDLQLDDEEDRSYSNNPMPPGNDNEERSDHISSWDTDFFKVDQQTLCQLIHAAYDLDIKGLQIAACRTAANMIKGKTAHQIRQMLNIKSNFTPSEEEKIQQELSRRVNKYGQQVRIEDEPWDDRF